ncbi:uncharacterized protein LOC119615138 [Lucilia sericata]|uniref:uncharacterized protein LOC119615138 n=1 Tax=Lucilia sericata TaxID=13632 RepID=UPI0018A80EEA|nr:uncharacterized protein LOC119615138 [Lucilia sericata]XP_037827146.1 uncharacterized protein LOC119615138 [Lucilia sericata]XP_037827148.1 uncharacterized protein LOC119615138 [Lucilia sericata]
MSILPIPPATTIIITQSLEKFPNVRQFLEALVKTTKIEKRQVGRSFQYSKDVKRKRLNSEYGVFVNYFIRKHLSNQFNIEAMDANAEEILKNPSDYITGDNLILRNLIKEHYEIFKDPNNKAMDIIKSIKIVSLSSLISAHRHVPKSGYTVNEDNLLEIIDYLEKVPYKSVILNPQLDCDYFTADADLIFDDEVIYEINTSKYESLSLCGSNLPLSRIYLTIIYGFGFYKKTGKKVKQFKIYNTLLGAEFSVELHNIDYKLFEEVLRQDVAVYSRLELEKRSISTIPLATRVALTSLDIFPNVKQFFETLVKDTKIEERQIGSSFQYSEDVKRNRYFLAHGYFVNYFIRKYLSNQFNIEIMDTITEKILKTPSNYIIGKNLTLRNLIKEHYEIFKDPNTKAMDIIKSIKIVSLSSLISVRHDIPQSDYTVNEDNLLEIIDYLEKVPYKSVILNPQLDCDYFTADADLIFDDQVIYEIKTSQYKSLTYYGSNLPLSRFYLTIIYGFGFYKKTGNKVKKFKIYNPLLGTEFSVELDNIDYELFEEVLRQDVAVYSRGDHDYITKLLNTNK